MSRIVTTHYRYQRPPRKSKPVPLAGPAVVTRRAKTLEAEPAAAAPPPANDDGTPKRPAIVTARRPGKRYVAVPDMTPEEHQRRGDAADAMFQEFKRRIAEAKIREKV